MTDKDRLDFLERNPDLTLRYRKGYWSLGCFSNYEYDVFKTVREAIDASINEHNKTLILTEYRI